MESRAESPVISVLDEQADIYRGLDSFSSG